MSPDERAAIEALKQYKDTGGEKLAEGLVEILRKLSPEELRGVYQQAGIQPESSAMAANPLAGLKAEEKPIREAQQKAAAQITPTITPQPSTTTPEAKPAGPQPAPAAPPAPIPLQPAVATTEQNQPSPSPLPVQPRPTVKAAATTAATVAVTAGAVAAKAAVPAMAPVITAATPVAIRMAISGGQALLNTSTSARDRFARPVTPQETIAQMQTGSRTDRREFRNQIEPPRSRANKLPDATPLPGSDLKRDADPYTPGIQTAKDADPNIPGIQLAKDVDPNTPGAQAEKPTPPVAATPTLTPLATTPKPGK